jgi:hypothetical protein
LLHYELRSEGTQALASALEKNNALTSLGRTSVILYNVKSKKVAKKTLSENSLAALKNCFFQIFFVNIRDVTTGVSVTEYVVVTEVVFVLVLLPL